MPRCGCRSVHPVEVHHVEPPLKQGAPGLGRIALTPRVFGEDIAEVGAAVVVVPVLEPDPADEAASVPALHGDARAGLVVRECATAREESIGLRLVAPGSRVPVAHDPCVGVELKHLATIGIAEGPQDETRCRQRRSKERHEPHHLVPAMHVCREGGRRAKLISDWPMSQLMHD